MSKKTFRAHASSSRVVPLDGGAGFAGGFGASGVAFGTSASPLSYLTEQPDLSSFADPNLVVHFKNLSKKDSTTKAKALEEISAFVDGRKRQQEEIDEAFLAAWTKVFPRASIEDSRRVRQLAQSLHGQISSASGYYDSDKGVARCTHDAFNTVFNTPEKQTNVSKAYQGAVLGYCRDIILHESPQTLSDERNTTTDDAEAKYARVLSSSFQVVSHLIEMLDDTELSKQGEIYEEIMGSEDTWKFLSSKDASIRRSILTLLGTCLRMHPALIDQKIGLIANHMLSKRAAGHQNGSALQYLESLRSMTEADPQIWISDLGGKKNSAEHLVRLFKAGSQGASTGYWHQLRDLIKTLPKACLPTSYQGAYEMLGALRSGITKKDEPRKTVEEAWTCYCTVTILLAANVSEDDASRLLTETALPIAMQYLDPKPDTSLWTIASPKALQMVDQLLRYPPMTLIARDRWPLLAAHLIADIETSAPEQSKDFQSSQNNIGGKGERWFLLQARIVTAECTGLKEVVKDATRAIISTCLGLLTSRNGKPYGAATIINCAITRHKSSLVADPELFQSISVFVRNSLPEMMFSPAQSRLLSIMYHVEEGSILSACWDACANAIIQQERPDDRRTAMQHLISAPERPDAFEQPQHNLQVQKFLTSEIGDFLEGAPNSQFVNAILPAWETTFSKLTQQSVLKLTTAALARDSQVLLAMLLIELLVRNGVDFSQISPDSPEVSEMIHSLLASTESLDDTVSARAIEVNALAQTAMARTASTGSGDGSLKTVLQDELQHAGPKSLSVETLIELGEKILDSEAKSPTNVTTCLPVVAKFEKALSLHLEAKPLTSTAITNRLGGLVYLIQAHGSDIKDESTLTYDKDGYSSALRMACYCARLLSSHDKFDVLDTAIMTDILRLLYVTAQLANEQLGMMRSHALWSSDGIVLEEDIMNMTAEVQKLTNTYIYDHVSPNESRAQASKQSLSNALATSFFRRASGHHPPSFYYAIAFATLSEESLERQGMTPISSEELDETLSALWKKSDTLTLCAFVAANCRLLAHSAGLARICNELVTDLTVADATTISRSTLERLIVLNIIIADLGPVLETIAKQRIIFYVKHVVMLLSLENIADELKAEMFKTLVPLLPLVKEIYGDMWSEVLKAITTTLKQAPVLTESANISAVVPRLHAALRTLAVLRSMLFDEETNDDLKEAWEEYEERHSEIAPSLLHLLKQATISSNSSNQPVEILTELLARQIAKTPLDLLSGVEGLYPLLTVSIQPVQQTAFDLLHKQIPALQGEISVNVALENTVARLPEELISLIIEYPTLDSIAELSFNRSMPPMLRGYFSSWILVFDHFKNASDKVAADYSAHLKEGDYLSGLLGFIFDFLGHARGKPLDVAKFEVTTYSFDIEESSLRDVQWALTYLYYLSLKRLPTLTKTWWTDCKSRQTVVNVVTWTETYFSPHIITAAFDAVRAWNKNQDEGSDDALTIKINPRAREIFASRLVDDQSLSFAIRLPTNFPLGQALVEGVNRVAVDEKKWHSWQLNSQGVITFSNNSLVDGIVAFRRNIAGALKGQTECAICYSIVSQDKQLPTKRCGTCRNLFHGVCLLRWFKSSNSSSCPLCRNPFNYS